MLRQVCDAMHASQAQIQNLNAWERHYATSNERQHPGDKYGMDHARECSRESLAMGSRYLMTVAPANDPIGQEAAPCL